MNYILIFLYFLIICRFLNANFWVHFTVKMVRFGANYKKNNVV